MQGEKTSGFMSPLPGRSRSAGRQKQRRSPAGLRTRQVVEWEQRQESPAAAGTELMKDEMEDQNTLKKDRKKTDPLLDQPEKAAGRKSGKEKEKGKTPDRHPRAEKNSGTGRPPKPLTVHLRGSGMKILLPADCQPVELPREVTEAAGMKPEASYRRAAPSSSGFIFFLHPPAGSAMNPDDVQGLIREIRSHLDDTQGIIEVKSGVTPRGFRYVYSMVKTLPEPPDGGVDYYVRINLFSGREVLEIQGDFAERGTTGMRESAGFNLAIEAGMVSLAGKGLKDWSQDPYDPSWIRGRLMNKAEKEGLDLLFPDGPLAQAREFLLAVLEDRYVLPDQEDLDVYADKKVLTSLFTDGCRRTTVRITV